MSATKRCALSDAPPSRLRGRAGALPHVHRRRRLRRRGLRAVGRQRADRGGRGRCAGGVGARAQDGAVLPRFARGRFDRNFKCTKRGEGATPAPPSLMRGSCVGCCVASVTHSWKRKSGHWIESVPDWVVRTPDWSCLPDCIHGFARLAGPVWPMPNHDYIKKTILPDCSHFPTA